MWDALHDVTLIILLVAGTISLVVGLAFEDDKAVCAVLVSADSSGRPGSIAASIKRFSPLNMGQAFWGAGGISYKMIIP